MLRETQDQTQKTRTFPLFPSTSAAPRHERRDAAQHRQRILAAAHALFTEHGIDAVSMHQIARTAGVGQGTLYRRYEHKGQLCLALLDASMLNFQHTLLAYLEQSTDEILALDQLIYVLEALITFNEENAPLLGAITEAACGGNRDRSPLYLWLRQIVVVLLQRFCTCVERSELDVEYTADAVLAPLAIDVYLYQRLTLGFSQARIASGVRHFLLYGLAPIPTT